MDKKLKHFANLSILAHADKVLHPKEIAFLKNVAKRLNIDDKTADEIIQNPENQSYDMISVEEVERYVFLDDFLNLVMIDGEIHENEIIECRNLSKKLGFDTALIDDIINRMKYHIEKGFNENTLTQEIKFDIYSLSQKTNKYDNYN